MELSRAEEAAGAPGKPQPHLGLIQVELPWLLSLLCSECSRLEQGSSPSPSLTCSRHWDIPPQDTRIENHSKLHLPPSMGCSQKGQAEHSE